MVINVVVADQKHHPLAGLTADDFGLSQNGQPQQIGSVTADAPACIGLIVDASGSMRSKLPGITAALLDFIRAANARDRFFVVNFNDVPYLDQEWTGDISLIEPALRRANARGGTTLFDTIIASADHIAKAPCNKRVLVVISDGGDNESRKSLPQAVSALQDAKGTMVYAIGLEVDRDRRNGRQTLQALTTATGGRPFFADNSKDAGKALAQASEEIRSLYTITFLGPEAVAGPPKISIVVRGKNEKDTFVRTSIPVAAVPAADGANPSTVPAPVPAKQAAEPPK